MGIEKLKLAAQFHLKRGDSMQMDPKVVLELCGRGDAVENKQAEPVHFRAVICKEQQEQALGVVPKIVGFVDKKAAEQFILEKRDFQGWKYNLEPLYDEAPAVAVNEQMIEENDVVSIPREVVDFIADRLAVKLFDDPNGPMFLLCDGCGESVRTGYRRGKPIAHESDIKHDPWCPLVWVKNFLNDEETDIKKQAIAAAEAAKGGA